MRYRLAAIDLDGALLRSDLSISDRSRAARAGLGVAVANAQQAALDAADEITASNEEDGVALMLERLTASAGPATR